MGEILGKLLGCGNKVFSFSSISLDFHDFILFPLIVCVQVVLFLFCLGIWVP